MFWKRNRNVNSKLNMSALCQNFVQNAWKKDLCSNCFKSKDEHVQNKPKPTPIGLSKSVEGIIRNGEKVKPKRTVEFTEKLSEVIGYGGEDWSSDLEEDDDASDENSADDDTDLSTEGDDEKELQKLTKANTDFNANSLQEVVSEVKKSYTQLMLGKPQLDSDGKKQTLLVSVTPFGQESGNNGLKKYTKTVSHIPVAKANVNNKDSTLIESKNNVILTSYSKKDKEEKSLLDEISETLENSKNPIQIISRKKIEKEVILSKPEIIPTSNKENIDSTKKKTEEIIEITKSDSKLEAKLVKSNIPERKNGLSRTPVIKKDQEKPVIYQTSVAKIELMNTKNLKLSNSKENLSNKNLSKFNASSPKTETPSSPKGRANQNEIMELKRDLSQKIVEDSPNKDIPSDDSLVSVSSSDEASRHILEETPKNKPKLAPQPPPVTNSDNMNSIITQTREQAGEPDGRADPENVEPPALPLTPPPILDSHTSFLHNNNNNNNKASPVEKPKIPSKPATIVLRKSPTNIAEHPPVILSSFISDSKANDASKTKLEKQDSNGSDIYKAVSKRRAPQPPPTSGEDLVFYARHPMNAEAAIARDRERKERASSCSPDMSNINVNSNGFPEASTPEPAPRRSLSLSTDSLTAGSPDEKKKEKRSRFSLKKFLRMGSSKDLPKLTADTNKSEDPADPLPQPKPRLVIVHPLELNGAKVEVVSKPVNTSADNVDYCNMVKQANGVENCNQRAVKPPPPPRNYEEWHYSKPNIPHPPKSQDILNKQKEYSIRNGNSKKIETVYANIGEVRSAIIPNKPHRTASMREREAQQQKQQRTHGGNNNYEPINVPNGKDSSENVYDYISSARSSSPECDSSKDSPTSKANGMKNGLSQRSESSVDVSGDYFKYQNIPRSMSLTYCGSETESEIYSPYSFYGSESEVTEDDHEWSNHGGRTHKLRSRKGRSIVHKNLEDNYGAVVVANHEALAQVLENIQQNTTIQPALRGLKTAPNLRWSDFTIKNSLPPVVIGPRAFHQAVWGTQHVTLVISTGPTPSSSLSLGMFSLVPVTEFSDLIPVKYVPIKETDEAEHLQATVAVLPWMQVHTLQSYGEIVKSKLAQNNDEAWKDTNFVLLQLVNALKTLQAQGIEELPLALSTFVLCKEVDKDTHYRLYVLQGLGEDLTRKSNVEPFGTLCMCATSALRKLQATAKLSTLLQSLLSNERAVSLTQVKSVLEFSLWGPSDVALGSTVRDRELALQRWLDLQRATVLHGLVCTKVHLTVYEECHLLFLVRSNARMMCDASMLQESSNKQNYVINVQK